MADSGHGPAEPRSLVAHSVSLPVALRMGLCGICPLDPLWLAIARPMVSSALGPAGRRCLVVRDPGEVVPQRVADLPQPLRRPPVDHAQHGLGLRLRGADDRDACEEPPLEALRDAHPGRVAMCPEPAGELGCLLVGDEHPVDADHRSSLVERMFLFKRLCVGVSRV
jgi:hypothetical protein